MFETDFHFINGGKFCSRGSGRHSTRRINSMELIYVLGGTLDMFEDEREFRLQSGDFLYLYPDRLHGGLAPYSSNLSFFWGHFNGEISTLERFPQSGHISNPGKMGNYISMILSEQALGKEQLSCDLLLALMMNETLRTQEDNSGMNKPLATAAEHIIRLHFAEEISTVFIAERLNCNADYLGRVFHCQFNCTVTEYLNHVRLQNAASLLSSGYFSIKEAAYNSGFSDLSYFRKRFLQEFSMRPSEYRRQRLAAHINTQ